MLNSVSIENALSAMHFLAIGAELSAQMSLQFSRAFIGKRKCPSQSTVYTNVHKSTLPRRQGTRQRNSLEIGRKKRRTKSARQKSMGASAHFSHTLNMEYVAILFRLLLLYNFSSNLINSVQAVDAVKQVFNNETQKFYLFSDGERNFTESLSYCSSLNASLITIDANHSKLTDWLAGHSRDNYWLNYQCINCRKWPRNYTKIARFLRPMSDEQFHFAHCLAIAVQFNAQLRLHMWTLRPCTSRYNAVCESSDYIDFHKTIAPPLQTYSQRKSAIAPAIAPAVAPANCTAAAADTPREKSHRLLLHAAICCAVIFALLAIITFLITLSKLLRSTRNSVGPNVRGAVAINAIYDSIERGRKMAQRPLPALPQELGAYYTKISEIKCNNC